MSKSSKYIVNQRIADVSEMLIEGRSRGFIVQFGSDNWNIGERQVDKYISKAREVVKGGVIRNLEFDYAKAVRRYESLYQKAMENEDYRLALSVNKEIVNLQGLSKIQIEHSTNVNFISNIPD